MENYNYPISDHSQDFGNDSSSDESDGEENYVPANPKDRRSDSNLMLDTWLAELDSLTTVR